MRGGSCTCYGIVSRLNRDLLAKFYVSFFKFKIQPKLQDAAPYGFFNGSPFCPLTGHYFPNSFGVQLPRKRTKCVSHFFIFLLLFQAKNSSKKAKEGRDVEKMFALVYFRASPESMQHFWRAWLVKQLHGQHWPTVE